MANGERPIYPDDAMIRLLESNESVLERSRIARASAVAVSRHFAALCRTSDTLLSSSGSILVSQRDLPDR